MNQQPVSLRDVIARLQLATERANTPDRDAVRVELEKEQARTDRRDRLARESISLTTELHRAIVNGDELPVQTTAIRATRKWMGLSDIKPVLVLSGGTGCGKSTAAAWAVANSHHGGHWRSAADVCRAFMGNFGEALNEQKLVKDCYFLVVDDLGAETDVDRMQGYLIEVLDQRKRAPSRTRTIITTNLDEHSFRLRYPDGRLESRLKECAHWVHDKGDDMRMGRGT